MKKSSAVWSIWNYVEALILMAAGVLAIVFRENEDLQNVIAYVAGAFVILDGVLRILMVIMGEKKSETSIMLVGGFEITIGIVVILEAYNFINIVTEFLFILLIVVGLLLIIYSILQIIAKSDKLYMPILEIVFAAILVALGIGICIIYYGNGDSRNQLVLVIIGIILALAGLTQAIITSITLIKAKKKAKKDLVPTDDGKKKKEAPKEEPKKEKDDNVIDVPAEETKAIEQQDDDKKK